MKTENANSKKSWLISGLFGIAGYAALVFVASGELGFLKVIKLLRAGDTDAGAFSLMALSCFYGAWLSGLFKANKQWCLCASLGAVVFSIQLAITDWHPVVLIPLIASAIATLFLVLLWIDTGSLEYSSGDQS